MCVRCNRLIYCARAILYPRERATLFQLLMITLYIPTFTMYALEQKPAKYRQAEWVGCIFKKSERNSHHQGIESSNILSLLDAFLCYSGMHLH